MNNESKINISFVFECYSLAHAYLRSGTPEEDLFIQASRNRRTSHEFLDNYFRKILSSTKYFERILKVSDSFENKF